MELADHPAPARAKREKKAKPLPHQILWEARQLAGQHHMFVVEKQDTVKGHQVPVYLLYRQAMFQQPTTKLGKSRSPAGLLKLVQRWVPGTP